VQAVSIRFASNRRELRESVSDDPKRVIVTGGGGGLGRELVLALAKRGQSVAAVDIDQAGLERTAILCRESGLACQTIAADLTVAGRCAHVVDIAAERFGGLDALINCAAVGYIESFLGMTEERWSRTLAVNVTALVTLTVATVQLMIKQGVRGRVVNITSPASRMALPNYAAYAASKAAVDSFTRASAVQLARYGISVNSVSPGMMDTEMQKVTEAALAAVEGRQDLDAFLAERTNRIPLGRRADIGEVVDSILWLTLDAPPYVICERLNVSGGLDKD
jgi:NAD(P)-dependent dehydrogenase (short-subunit alcohol dehydrogenase family)